MIFSSISASFFTQYIAKLANKKHVQWGDLLRSEYRDSKVFMLGLYAPSNIFWKRVKCKKMLIVFSGSDVISLKKMKDKDRNELIYSLEKKGYRFASNGNFLKKEMEEIYKFRNKVGVIRLPSPHIFPGLKKMPNKFSVGVYTSQKNPKLYGYDIIIKAMKELKDIDFYFYSLKGYKISEEEKKIENFKCLSSPVKNMTDFLENISCGLRVTEHDASCMSAVEYNMAGRWFVFNHDMDYCIRISNVPSVEEVVNALLKLKKEKYNIINEEGSKYYRKKHNINKFMKTVRSLYE